MQTSIQRIAFVGHSYHKKTKSFDFFTEILQNLFKVDFFFDETWAGGTPLNISAIGVSQYDVIILWQQIHYVLHPDIDKHPNVILVPMFDCHAQNLSEFQRFISNTNLKFINFCRAQHEACIEYGLNSLSAQYFPKLEKFDWNRNYDEYDEYDELVGFFWPRRKEITWAMVAKLISKGQISRLFFHAAPDRGFPPAIPPEKARKQYQISISEWFDTREELFQLLAGANVYFAPRLYEGIGLSFLEAMAMGMCVVVPDTPTMNEYITHGVNGLLYDPNHPVPLEFSEAQQLGARARESVEAGHKRWLTSIDDVLDFIAIEPVDIQSIQHKAPAQESLSKTSDPSTLRNLVSETGDATSPPQARLYGGLRTQGKVKKHTEEHPLITIATVTYDAENELPGTLTSILSQTYHNIELIIVDGDSTDGTLQIVKDNEQFIDLWISEPDKGPYDAMNKAAGLARGEWLLFLNAGDWFTNNNILEEVIKNTPRRADIIYGHHYYQHASGNMFWHRANAFEWTHEMLRKGQLTNAWVKGIPGHQATLTRTSLLRKPGYDIEQFSYASDHDFLFRISKAGCTFHHTDLTIAVYTSGGFSWQNAADCMREQWHIARKYGPRRLVDKFYRKRIRHVKKEQNRLHLSFSRFMAQGLKSRFTAKFLHTVHLLKTYVVIWKSGLFSSKYYRDQYPEMFKGEIKKPLRHYILKGGNERKNPNPLFDTGYYLDRNPDVAACGINPLYHYIICGAQEGREPGPHTSMAEYLEQNPDLDPFKTNPLRHYLKNFGKNQIKAEHSTQLKACHGDGACSSSAEHLTSQPQRMTRDDVQFQNGKPQLKGVDTIAWTFGKKNRTFKLATEDGNKITIKFPPPSDMESFFVFSLHKCGSTLINNMMVDVCNYLKLSYIDLEGSIFKQGYMPAHINGDISSLFFGHGFAYLGFRSFWVGKDFDVTRNKCLLLIRDPRDAMVSHYFSYLYSHGIPASGPISKTMSENRAKLIDTDINEYILRPQFINTFKNGLKRYEKFLSPKMTRTYRYEDVIYYKHEWLTDMLDYLGLALDSETVSRIAKKHNIRPSKEDPSNHIRQVAPGNFRQHLTAETIGKLNSALADILKKYGYDQVRSVSL